MRTYKGDTIPNLYIIGAMKSGTSSLHEHLKKHPDIFMSNIKEPGYFAKCVDYYPDDFDWYMSLFKDVRNEKVIGESSTHYTKLPTCKGVAQNIREYNPNAKFIYIMRDPIKRTISHYWHNVRKKQENKDMMTAIRNNPEYVAFSDYAYQLQPYFKHFGEEKILALTFEELVDDPVITLKHIFKWLNVDPNFPVNHTDQKHNAIPDSFTRFKGTGFLYRFRSSSIWNSIAPLVPKTIKSAASKLTEEDTIRLTDKDDEVNNFLNPIFAEKLTNLEQLLNRRFDVWDY